MWRRTNRPMRSCRPAGTWSAPAAGNYTRHMCIPKPVSISKVAVASCGWERAKTRKSNCRFWFTRNGWRGARAPIPMALFMAARRRTMLHLQLLGTLSGRVTSACSRCVEICLIRSPVPRPMLPFATGKEGGTVPKRSTFTCRSCGTQQDVLTAIRPTGKTGPSAGYAIQAVSPSRKESGATYGGRFFAAFDDQIARQYSGAVLEWDARKGGDLAPYWPRSEVPFGFMTHMNNGGIPNHGFTHWWTMFNARQMLVLTQLMKAIVEVGEYDWPVREYVLGAYQQYLRNQNQFCIWDTSYDKLVPHMSNNNYHPKSNMVENCVFSDLGRGNWNLVHRQ